MPVRPLLAGALLALAPLGGTVLAAPKVVASIPPVHSLVAGVMAGVGEPYLLLKGGSSPHSYAMKPSDARALAEAELVFWVGETLETFLAKPLAATAQKARIVELIEAPGVERLPIRDGEGWEDHGHEEEEGHAPDHGHDHDKKHGDGNAAHGHEHDEVDAHIWLSTGNAGAIVAAAAAALAEADPANAAAYRSNAEAVKARLAGLADEVTATLTPVRGRPYMVFHDAYQHFERQFGTTAVGSVTVSPERQPGARHLLEMRRKLQEAGAVCLFSEPQFEPRLVRTVAEGTDVRTGILDPLGAALTPGPESYFALMRGLADSMRTCLSPTTN